MKFHETLFDEYLSSTKNKNLHPKNEIIFKRFPKNIMDLKNLIFYGPSGIGKYTQMLRCIKIYSQSELKYEKKISINISKQVNMNKSSYFIKISDIHYEVDMSLLGCNSKMFWHEIYLQIIDIISAKNENSGIIVCKNFHDIHSELLDNFYSYMQKNNVSFVDLKFIIITEEISFIPDNIINCCQIINIPRPTKNNYLKSVKKLPKKVQLETITNIKNTKKLQFYNEELMVQYKIICNKIIKNLLNIEEIQYLKFRDLLYDMFIYNLDISDCIWYIISFLVNENKIQKEHISSILIKTYCFFQYYNNNYRPIYHIENYFLNIAKLIHNL
jgi:hypothetical protein